MRRTWSEYGFYTITAAAIITSLYYFHAKPVTAHFLQAAGAEVIRAGDDFAGEYQRDGWITYFATYIATFMGLCAVGISLLRHRWEAIAICILTVYLILRQIAVPIVWRMMLDAYDTVMIGV